MHDVANAGDFMCIAKACPAGLLNFTTFVIATANEEL